MDLRSSITAKRRRASDQAMDQASSTRGKRRKTASAASTNPTKALTKARPANTGKTGAVKTPKKSQAPAAKKKTKVVKTSKQPKKAMDAEKTAHSRTIANTEDSVESEEEPEEETVVVPVKKAVDKLMEITELIEAIILELPMGEILRFQSMSKHCKKVVETSPMIQQRLFLKPPPPALASKHMIINEAVISHLKETGCEVVMGNNVEEGTLVLRISHTAPTELDMRQSWTRMAVCWLGRPMEKSVPRNHGVTGRMPTGKPPTFAFLVAGHGDYANKIITSVTPGRRPRIARRSTVVPVHRLDQPFEGTVQIWTTGGWQGSTTSPERYLHVVKRTRRPHLKMDYNPRELQIEMKYFGPVE